MQDQSTSQPTTPTAGGYYQPPPPPKSGPSKLLIFGCAGGCLLAVIALAVGIFGFGYFAVGVFAEQVANDLRTNPVVVEHLGTIEEIETDIMASSAIEAQDVFVFDVKGAKGEGRIRAECVTIDGATEKVVSGTLELSTGEVYDLFPDQDAEAGDDP